MMAGAVGHGTFINISVIPMLKESPPSVPRFVVLFINFWQIFTYPFLQEPGMLQPIIG